MSRLPPGKHERVRAAGRTPGPWPAPLPVPVAPVAGEALASFLGRLATANRTTPEAVLDILPPWFRVLALIETNSRQVTESTPQALFQAAAYPEAVTAAAEVCARATGFRH